MTTVRSLLSQARRHCHRLAVTTLLLSLPVWSGCFTPTATTISNDHITNTATRSSSFAVEIPPGYTARAIPEYLPHVPFTPQWLDTDEAAAFADFSPTQALEQKLYADHQLYHRPNYLAYFSISGEDFLLTPTAQADTPAPSPFFVFSVIHTRNASGRYVFPGLGSNNLGTFGNWVAAALRAQHADVSLSQRTILGLQWVWLTTELPYPLPTAENPALAFLDAPKTSIADTSLASPDAKAAQIWKFAYVATPGSGGTLYTIQGWSLPDDHTAMMDALETIITSLNLRPQDSKSQ